MFKSLDFTSVFTCMEMEEAVRKYVNSELEAGHMPNFDSFHKDPNMLCSCLRPRCDWSKENIEISLSEKGILKRCEEYLKEKCQ